MNTSYISNRCTTKDIHKKQEVLLCKFPVETVEEAIVLLEKEFNQDINL